MPRLLTRLTDFLAAERKTLLGLAALLGLVAWVWLSNPAPKPPPLPPATVVPGERLGEVRIGQRAAEVEAALGPPAGPPRRLPLGIEAWSYPQHGLQVDLHEGAVTAIRARLQPPPAAHTQALADLGLVMAPNIPPRADLSLARVGKLTHDWRRLDGRLLPAQVRPRALAVSDAVTWRVYPGFIAITTSDDPKQPPKLTEVIVSSPPRVPEVWEPPKR
jgi:hypothetical protein